MNNNNTFDTLFVSSISNLSEEDRKQIYSTLQSATEESLLVDLAKQEVGNAVFGVDYNEIGRKVWNYWQDKIQAEICSKEIVKAYISDPNIMDATVVASLVSAHLKATVIDGVNYVLIGCLAARIGLRFICKSSKV